MGVLLALAVLEISIRVFDAVRGRSWNARTAWYWMFERDPYLGFRGRANATFDFGPGGIYRHDAEGFRDERGLDAIARLPDRRLIVCVGEASTYGSGAPDARQTYPARLEAHLRRLTGDDRFVVYNAGVPAYSTVETVAQLQLRLLKHRPEAVVMMSLRGDVEHYARVLDARVGYGDLPIRAAPRPSTWIDELAMHSSLVGLVATRFARATSDAVRETPQDARAPVTRDGRALYTANLARAAFLCRAAGSRLLAVDPPIHDDDALPARRAATAELRRALHETCTSERIVLLAADRPLRDSGFVGAGGVHLGPEGYDRLAGILAPALVAALASPEVR